MFCFTFQSENLIVIRTEEFNFYFFVQKWGLLPDQNLSFFLSLILWLASDFNELFKQLSNRCLLGFPECCVLLRAMGKGEPHTAIVVQGLNLMILERNIIFTTIPVPSPESNHCKQLSVNTCKTVYYEFSYNMYERVQIKTHSYVLWFFYIIRSYCI